MKDASRARRTILRAYWISREVGAMSYVPALACAHSTVAVSARSRGVSPRVFARSPALSPRRVGHVRPPRLTLHSLPSGRIEERFGCAADCMRTYARRDRARHPACRLRDSESATRGRFAGRITSFSRSRSRVVSACATMTESYRLRVRGLRRRRVLAWPSRATLNLNCLQHTAYTRLSSHNLEALTYVVF
jgi:hypothetical protein